MHKDSGNSKEIVTQATIGPATNIDRPFESNFQRAVHGMTLYRPHLNACRGSESLRRYKRIGVKPMRYDEVIGFLVNARRDGARRGCAAEAVAVLINDIIRDTLPAGAALDVIARPAADDGVPVNSRRDEELCVAVSAAELITTVEKVTADGRIDHHEDRELEHTVEKLTRGSRRLADAARRETKR